MFTESAALYDAIGSFKDYAREAAEMSRVVRDLNPHARTILDVACGTGEIDDANGVHRRSEVHELGLFTLDEMAGAFEHAGLRAGHEPDGFTGRGSWIATEDRGPHE